MEGAFKGERPVPLESERLVVIESGLQGEDLALDVVASGVAGFGHEGGGEGFEARLQNRDALRFDALIRSEAVRSLMGKVMAAMKASGVPNENADSEALSEARREGCG